MTKEGKEPQFELPTVRGHDLYQTLCQSAYCALGRVKTHTHTHTHTNALTYMVSMTMLVCLCACVCVGGWGVTVRRQDGMRIEGKGQYRDLMQECDIQYVYYAHCVNKLDLSGY